MVQVAKRLNDPPVAVLVSLLAPFAAWIPAELLQVSGVLSVVTAGIVLGRAAPRIMSSDTRVLGSGVWQMVIFVLNGLVFILIGLQLPTILEELRATWTPAQLAVLAVAVSLTVIVVRMVWVFPATYLPRLLIPGLKERDPAPPPQIVVILGWAGMRGVVSLAAALALPLTVEGGAPFPARDLLQFLTFAVILATLVGQGLTLPWLIRRLGVGDDGSEQHDEIHAREAANSAALERLDELAEEWPGHLELIDQMRARYEHAAEHLEHEHSDDEGEIPPDQEMIDHAAIRQAVIDAQRVAIIDLRDRRVIGDAGRCGAWSATWTSRSCARRASRAVEELAGLDPQRQPVLRRRQRAGGVGREDTRRVVGQVEVDHARCRRRPRAPCTGSGRRHTSRPHWWRRRRPATACRRHLRRRAEAPRPAVAFEDQATGRCLSRDDAGDIHDLHRLIRRVGLQPTGHAPAHVDREVLDPAEARPGPVQCGRGRAAPAGRRRGR